MYAPQITKHVIWFVADTNLQNLVTLWVGEKLLRFIDTCDVSSQGCNQQQPWSYLSWLLGFGNNNVVSSCCCHIKVAKVKRALTCNVTCIFIITFARVNVHIDKFVHPILPSICTSNCKACYIICRRFESSKLDNIFSQWKTLKVHWHLQCFITRMQSTATMVLLILTPWVWQ